MLSDQLNRSIPAVPNLASATQLLRNPPHERPKPNALNISRHAKVLARHTKIVAIADKVGISSPLMGEAVNAGNRDRVTTICYSWKYSTVESPPPNPSRTLLLSLLVRNKTAG